MRILTPEELKDIDSVGNGKTIAGVLDDEGDTHSICIVEPCLPVIRVAHSNDDKTEAYRITVRDALILSDTAGLNTTANDLRAKLATAGALLMSQDAQLAEAQRQLAEAERVIREQKSTIASLRQRDTVRPEALIENPSVQKRVSMAWSSGFSACNNGEDFYSNPYGQQG